MCLICICREIKSRSKRLPRCFIIPCLRRRVKRQRAKTPNRFLNSKLYTKTITTPTGKRKYIRAATKEEKEELERKHQQAKLEIGAGMDTTDSTPFGKFTQLWYNTYKRPNLRENSKENAHYDRLVRLESTAEKVRTATGLSVSGTAV